MKSNKSIKRTVGIIPARYGSTRFPAKMLALISGKTVIQRTYENALRCKALDLVVVATDHSLIYDHIKSFGGNVVMTSVSCETGSDRLAEAIRNDDQFNDATIIIGIQGDEPCIDPIVIQKVAEALSNDPLASMSTAITPLKSNEEALSPSIVKCVIDNQQNALYFSRALIPAGHTLKMEPGITYYRHIGLYGFRRDFLLRYGELPTTPLQKAENLEQLKVLEHGFRIKTAVVASASIGVDLPDDIQRVEQWLSKQNLSSSQAASAHL